MFVSGMSKCVFIAVFWGLLCTGGQAQMSVTDSLERVLKTADKEIRVDVLNQLTYEFITNDNGKVILYNNQALQLSKQLGYLKGEAIAYTYRGVFESLSAQFPEAHQDLHQGLRLSIQAGDRVNEGYTLLQLGVCGLEEVETDSALFYFGKAYEIYKDSTNPVTLSKIYRNMSAAYGQRNQYERQQYYLDRSIAIRRLLSEKDLLAEALTLKANITIRLGKIENAETILTEIEMLRKDHSKNDENKNDLRHLRALILFQKGKFDEAAILVDSARDYYFSVSLFRKYVTLLMDISKIFSNRGDYELALNNLYEALRLSKLHGFDSETYATRNEIGWINFYLGDYQQAVRLANEALRSKPKRQLKNDLANALALKGVALRELNNFKEAEAILDSTRLLYKQLNNKAGVSEALMNIGYLRAKQKQYAQALALYQESIELAKSVNYQYGLAMSSSGAAEIYFKNGDYKKTTQLLDQSEYYARLVHANEILIRDYTIRRDLLAVQNRFKEALTFSIMANQLNDSIHHTELARRFVNLEKMQEIEQRDRDIKVLQQEKQLADDKISLQNSQLRQQFILLISGSVVIVLLGALAFVYFKFYARLRALNITITEKNTFIEAQAEKLKEVNVTLNQLYKEVSEQNEEIQTQASKLSDLNSDLERRVAEKTQELITTNEELVRHNNELLQFSYTVSHNLRGPVARLLGLTNLAAAEADLTKTREWISLMNKTGADLDLIIKDISNLLDLRNEPNQYREKVELEKEWQISLSLLQDSLTGKEEITASFSAAPSLITVRAMLQSIFYNLLSNAIKFRSPERPLRVTATSQISQGNLIIEISDNGLGFDIQRHRDNLFKLYKRFHSHVEGRGLGLYLIKAQVEVLRGEISVESTLNVGSNFRISIPCAPEA
jgi:signal transduction histidine kinase